MASQEISIISVDYARSLVTYALGNPTGLTVQMAFTTSAKAPLISAFVAAAWESLTAPYYVISLVGAGTLSVLPVGYYYKWIRVTNNPQLPAIPAGKLIITP